MMKKICSWLLVMALFAAALVGCGPREAQGDETIKDTGEKEAVSYTHLTLPTTERV